tara:strand:- start:494 stop:724 length:231 start_codon:yes stop_codon:yes gene_type:complete
LCDVQTGTAVSGVALDLPQWCDPELKVGFGSSELPCEQADWGATAEVQCRRHRRLGRDCKLQVEANRTEVAEYGGR